MAQLIIGLPRISIKSTLYRLNKANKNFPTYYNTVLHSFYCYKSCSFAFRIPSSQLYLFSYRFVFLFGSFCHVAENEMSITPRIMIFCYVFFHRNCLAFCRYCCCCCFYTNALNSLGYEWIRPVLTSLDPRESALQTVSRSVHSFLHSSLLYPTTQTRRPRYV